MRREGLRLDLRSAEVMLGGGNDDGEWRPFSVRWTDAPATLGWHRSEPGWVMAIAGGPAPERPRLLSAAP